MGLFSSKTKIYVDSVTYNLAGDYSDRINYLKGVVIGSVFQKWGNRSMGDSITYGLMSGTYNTQVNFLRWAKYNYKDGIPKSFLGNSLPMDMFVVREYIERTIGKEVVVESAYAGVSQAFYWAQQWIYINHPYIDDDEWTYDLYDPSAANPRMIIQVRNDPEIILPMPGYRDDGVYAYMTYGELIQKPGDDYETFDQKRIAIYRFGSGDAQMDANQPDIKDTANEFMPFMPVRIDNVFISEGSLRNKYYEPVKRAFKRAFGGSELDDLIDDLKENPSLKDIDYAFINWGVALNTERQSCKQYLFEYFTLLVDLQGDAVNTYRLWKEKLAESVTYFIRMGNNMSNDGSQTESSLVGYYRNLYQQTFPGDEPIRTVSYQSNWLPKEYQMSLHWVGVEQSRLTGAANPGRKVGEVWLDRIAPDRVMFPVVTERRRPDDDPVYTYTSAPVNIPQFNIYKQISAEVAIRLRVTGLKLQNVVYSGKSVWADSDDAFEDEDESKLVVPMHMRTFKKLSSKHKNQIATENAYIVFNCYVKVKVRWYQRGFFKILFVVVISVVGAIFTGGASLGLLGSAISVGSTIGFSGISAIIAGAVVNAIAGIILSVIIDVVSQELFGGALGGIIGAVLGIVAGGAISGFMSGGSIAINWGSFLRADNLLRLTTSAANSYAAYLQEGIQKMQQEYQQFSEQAASESRRIQRLMIEQFGYGGGEYIDPIAYLTDVENNRLIESGDTFLQRTLLTGSEIADLSQEMLYNFAELSLALPNAYD